MIAVEQPIRTCVQRRPDESVVQACGSMSLPSSRERSALDVGAGIPRVAWDLSLVTDLDAAGLGAWAESVRRAKEGGGSVYVSAASPVVHRLAALARLDTVVPGAWETRVAATPLCAAPCPVERGLQPLASA